MDESVKSGSRLDVSVSFGRFENDALSWEKWSSFSPNKYLEEVGSLSTPGSVAQKKAYFEAHYKRIAAKKAEEMEQEKWAQPAIPSPDVSGKEDCASSSSETMDNKFGVSNGERLAEEADCMPELMTDVTVADDEAKDDNATSSNGLMDVVADEEAKDDNAASSNHLMDVISSEEEKAVVAVKYGSSIAEEAKDELNVNVIEPELNVGKDAPCQGSNHTEEKTKERTIDTGRRIVPKKGNSKLNPRGIAEKVTPTKKENILSGTKSKVVSPPAAKPSTPKYSKPTSIAKPTSASLPSKKKVNNGPPLIKSKNSIMGDQSKKSAPTSLHMSLSLGPANSLAALSMTRKSLIMESMGDKDIVKRAFKTFQNRTNESRNDGKSSEVKNVSSTAFQPKISNYHTPIKGNKGLKKDAEKTPAQNSQLGSRSNPLPARTHKSPALDRKSTAAFSPASRLRGDENAEKRKEFMKKLEAKSIARGTENGQLSAKSKGGVENAICEQRTLNR